MSTTNEPSNPIREVVEQIEVRNNDREICICGHDRQWHREHTEVYHSFSTSRLQKGRNDRPQGVPVAQGPIGTPPGDSLLRMVLIRKGLITVEDLDEVAHELTTVGYAVGGSSGGNPEDRSITVTERGMRDSDAERSGVRDEKYL